jgi:hypothetical protein
MLKKILAILFVTFSLMSVIALAKSNKTTTCKEWCPEQPHADCEGKWQIGGNYPNCKCEFKCNKVSSSNSNKNNFLTGPWNAFGKNKLLCIANITTNTRVLLLRQTKGKFESWLFNGTSNSTTHYVAFPSSWYKPKVIENKVKSGHWQLINITNTDPRAVQCNITSGTYIVEV